MRISRSASSSGKPWELISTCVLTEGFVGSTQYEKSSMSQKHQQRHLKNLPRRAKQQKENRKFGKEFFWKIVEVINVIETKGTGISKNQYDFGLWFYCIIFITRTILL